MPKKKDGGGDERHRAELESPGEKEEEKDGEEVVIGIDGARTGWVVAMLNIKNGKSKVFRIRSLQRLEALLVEDNGHRVRCIAIDMPIGLASRAERGGRPCDRAARSTLQQARRGVASPSSSSKVVGPSSIFTPPSRPALEAFKAGATHKEVSLANMASAEEGAERQGLGLSIQTYHIMAKINELDQILIPGGEGGNACLQGRSATPVLEAHPELAFLRLSKGQAMPTKKGQQGRTRRFELLAGEMDLEALELDLAASTWQLEELGEQDLTSKIRTAADDVLDALACAVVALRWVHGEARVVLKGGEDMVRAGREDGSLTGKRHKEEERHNANTDERGLPMNIWACK